MTKLCPEFLEAERNRCTSVYSLIICRWLQPVANDLNRQLLKLISPGFEAAFGGLIILWLEVRILQGPPKNQDPTTSSLISEFELGYFGAFGVLCALPRSGRGLKVSGELACGLITLPRFFAERHITGCAISGPASLLFERVRAAAISRPDR